jgi:hypothetical protein
MSKKEGKNMLKEKGQFFRSAPRVAGLMFLLVIVVGLLSGELFLSPLNYSMTGPPKDISKTMISFSERPAMVSASITGFLVEAALIVLLALSLFETLKDKHKVAARWAFGLWLLEAVFLAMRQVNAFSLLYISQKFTEAGGPVSSYFQTLGSLFYKLMHFSYDVQMVFYSVGGVLFYSLFYKTRYVPRAISLFGIVVAALGFAGELFAIFGVAVPLYIFLPILPFELAIGFWLCIKGIKPGELAARTNK